MPAIRPYCTTLFAAFYLPLVAAATCSVLYKYKRKHDSCLEHTLKNSKRRKERLEERDTMHKGSDWGVVVEKAHTTEVHSVDGDTHQPGLPEANAWQLVASGHRIRNSGLLNQIARSCQMY